jgi:integrase
LDARARCDPRRPWARALSRSAGTDSALFEFLAYTGLRIGEALGLTLGRHRADNGMIRVHLHPTRHREHGPLKTDAARREVVLAPALGKLLLERSRSRRRALRFCEHASRSRDYRDVGEHFRATITRVGITTAGERLTPHSLPGFVSLLISHGFNVVFVSRQTRTRQPRTSRSAPTPTSTPAQTTPPPHALDASHLALTQSA